MESLESLAQISSQLEALRTLPETCVELKLQMAEVQALLHTISKNYVPLNGLAGMPTEEPPLLGVVPDCNEGKEGKAVRAGTTNSLQSQQSWKSETPAKPKPKGRLAKSMQSMEAVEADTLQVLLAPKKPTISASDVSSKNDAMDNFGEAEEDEGHSVEAAPMGSPSSRPARADGERVLQMCRRMSLDDLRINHDAVLATHGDTTRLHSLPLSDKRFQPFPPLVKLWLGMVGIWDLSSLRASVVLVLTCLVLLGHFGVVLWLSLAGRSDPYIATTTLCYLVGVVAAVGRLRYSGLQGVLTHEDGGLEAYARASGFLDDWRKISRRRLKEVMIFLLVMLCCRWLAFASDRFWEIESLDTAIAASCFSWAAMIYGSLVYLVLHIVAGMELAIDSFSVNFYREMDMELALGEWNTVQATLRTLSMKLSTSLVILGSSCAASLLLLVELTVINPEHTGLQAGLPLLCFTSWLFPPVLLFLYALMRAAGVTEKASRVAPLVNSWTFDEEGDGPEWMDVGRQYIVQYMIQSEAGFYLQGMRLHVFQVTKLCYYFAAFIFAMFSSSWS